MSTFYLDTSALLKRYNSEVGSEWINSLTDPVNGQVILLSEITLAEVAAALAAKQRAPRGITRKERDEALATFLHHCRVEYQLLIVNRHTIDRAVVLTQQHRLRGYDAVQLASAILANHALLEAGLMPLTFVAADNDLLLAAQAETLATDNPLTRP